MKYTFAVFRYVISHVLMEEKTKMINCKEYTMAFRQVAKNNMQNLEKV